MQNILIRVSKWKSHSFFSWAVFWVHLITSQATQLSNKPTNQVFIAPPSSPPNHPNIQPSPTAKYAFSLPSIRPIYHPSIQPSQHNSLSRFSWEIKSVDDLFGVNNSLSRFLWLSLDQIVHYWIYLSQISSLYATCSICLWWVIFAFLITTK